MLPSFFKNLWSLCAQVLGPQALHCQLLGVHAVVGSERSLTVLILRVRLVSTYIDFSYVCLWSRSLGLADLSFLWFWEGFVAEIGVYKQELCFSARLGATITNHS